MYSADRVLFEKTDLYRQVDPAAVERLIRDCPVQTYNKGAILTRQGEVSDYVYLILSGRIALTAECNDGESTVIAVFGEGELFVSPAVLLKQPYLVSAKTTATSRILRIPSERYRQALRAEHSLALMMTNTLAGHWRLLVDHLVELKLHTAIERLAHFLVRHCPTRSGAAIIRLHDDRKTIAAELGISPEFLSRTFQQLRKHGVSASGRIVRIADVEVLTGLYRSVAPCSDKKPAAATTPRRVFSGLKQVRRS
ncbi:MAG TPA: cyclic nucleotide-binding domain-containing protein [Ferrovibrio sp.]|uniref:cyclic nucleotide-binding domain-containing protein n=1 Tax=Ferrovibrio sp. TaxID=1917215 RepID=UPI002ED3D95A